MVGVGWLSVCTCMQLCNLIAREISWSREANSSFVHSLSPFTKCRGSGSAGTMIVRMEEHRDEGTQMQNTDTGVRDKSECE